MSEDRIQHVVESLRAIADSAGVDSRMFLVPLAEEREEFADAVSVAIRECELRRMQTA